MSTDWNLYGSGRRHRDEWAQLHQATRGWTAAWADNRGFHLDAMPAEPPETTHLWAWAPGRWLRARIDTPHWWAALLTPTPPASASRSSASMRPSPVLGSTACCPGATGTGASSTTGAGAPAMSSARTPFNSCRCARPPVFSSVLSIPSRPTSASSWRSDDQPPRRATMAPCGRVPGSTRVWWAVTAKPACSIRKLRWSIGQ